MNDKTLKYAPEAVKQVKENNDYDAASKIILDSIQEDVNQSELEENYLVDNLSEQEQAELAKRCTDEAINRFTKKAEEELTVTVEEND